MEIAGNDSHSHIIGFNRLRLRFIGFALSFKILYYFKHE